MTFQIGIDLGTTNSLIAHFSDGETRLIPNRHGHFLTPSVVSIDDAGNILTGLAARERLSTAPVLTAAAFKRFMGTDKTFRLGSRSFRAEELSALILKGLKEDAEAFLGGAVSDVVLTVPAYFNAIQRQATHNAAQMAGLNVLRLLNEPTAAGLAYGLQEKPDDTRFLVYDLGGGTFDVSVLDYFDGVVQVSASAGDPVDLIDGIDLERLLVKRTTGLRRPEKAPQVAEATKKLFPEGIPVFGADALRFTMASYASLGRSVNFDFKRAEGYRNFCNKLWNATNFVLMNVENHDCGQDETQPLAYTFADQWIIGRLQQTEAAVTEALDTYRFDLAAQTLYEFVWNEYCDWYIELAKVQIQTGCPTTQRTTRRTLVRVLEVILRLLHPVMPYITEELWQTVAPLANAKKTDSIMLAAWPVADEGKIVQTAFDQMTALQDLIGAVRNLRGEMGIAPNVKAPLFVEGSGSLEGLLKYLPPLTRLTEAKLVDALPEAEDAPVAVCNGARMMLKVEIDKAAETARLGKEAEKLQKALDKLQAKLAKPGYTEKAPAHLVEKDRAELAELEDKMAKVQNQLAKLKD